MFPSKAKGPRAAAQGIVAESPEPSRSAARTCSGKPDPKGCAQIVIGIGEWGLGVRESAMSNVGYRMWDVDGQLLMIILRAMAMRARPKIFLTVATGMFNAILEPK